jgi:hypothetical protein
VVDAVTTSHVTDLFRTVYVVQSDPLAHKVGEGKGEGLNLISNLGEGDNAKSNKSMSWVVIPVRAPESRFEIALPPCCHTP